MDRYRRMALFAEVVASGSLSAAGRQLGMSASAVSQQLRQLEKDLGLVLLHRSTRRLTLTEAGERYHAGCAAMVAAARQADLALERLRDAPEGTLRLACPIGFGPLLAVALTPVIAQPRLTLELLMDDTPIDLIAQRVDLALRVGQFADSSLVSRKLGGLRQQLAASPAYLARRGWPQTPQDLLQHDWLRMLPRSNAPDLLRLTAPDGRVHEVRPPARVHASQVSVLDAMCMAGWGLAAVVSQDVAGALADGRLAPVLPGWTLEDAPVYAVTPRRDEQPAKVRFVLELLKAYFDTSAAAPPDAAGYLTEAAFAASR